MQHTVEKFNQINFPFEKLLYISASIPSEANVVKAGL